MRASRPHCDMLGGQIDTREQRPPAPVRRLVARLKRDERGMSLIETVMASAIFVLVSTVTIATLVSSTTTTRYAKDRSIAEQGAASYLEKIKLMAANPNTYANIGTVAGNPAGTLPASQTFTGVNGENLGTPATMTTQVVYASSNVPGSYTSGYSYKRVTVTITRNVDNKVLASLKAFVAPPQRASGSTATINTTVLDAGNNQPVPGSTVSLATGPSAPESDVT